MGSSTKDVSQLKEMLQKKDQELREIHESYTEVKKSNQTMKQFKDDLEQLIQSKTKLYYYPSPYVNFRI